ncbi:putative protein kinase RLK-Pelle-LRR-XI-1 family [Helianthus annuus]|nr:putative protein kinase RLK-Pelle-LRR-XI-1 family [Helianthus annuus]
MALLSFIVLFTILCFIWGAARPYKAEITVKQLLQSNRNSDWETRYKIAVGSAQGLAYIHQDCVPAILHKDVKCNNILLDCKYEAYLVDFGLAKLMNSANYQHAMSRVTGSYGYIAPGKFFLLLSLNHELIIILTSGFSLLFITDQNSARLKQAKPISLCVTGSQSYGYCPLTWCTNVKSGGFTLQSNRNSDWETRYKIAVGSAQGLAYIHQDCVPAILHRDVKCNNILLDCKYEAYLVDFGLAKPMNSANYQHAMSRVTGSYGYIAPGKFFLLLSLNHELIIILTSGFSLLFITDQNASNH